MHEDIVRVWAYNTAITIGVTSSCIVAASVHFTVSDLDSSGRVA